MCFREGEGDSVGHALLLGKDLDLFRGKETSGIQSDSIMQNRGRNSAGNSPGLLLHLPYPYLVSCSWHCHVPLQGDTGTKGVQPW